MGTVEAEAHAYVEGRHGDAQVGYSRFGGPLSTGLRSAVLCAVAAVAWRGTGYAVAVPVTLVAIAALVAAAWDIRTSRIPNGVVVFALVALTGSLPLVALVDDRALWPLLGDLAGGFALSGAPALFMIWLVAPRDVGGGDWKLLGVLGAAVGYLAPLGATVILMGVFFGGLVVAALTRRRDVILGPPLAFGYLIAIVAVIVAPDVFSNWYR
jgi:Flp pilus assembly protein protease CpaA